MIIFCDFDQTLFNTSALGNEYKRVCLPYGIDKSKWDYILTHFSSIASDQSALFSNAEFCNKAHELYGTNQSMLEKELNALVKESASEWLFSDTLDFLDKYDKKNLAIVTFGHTHFQTQKIRYSGIEDYFSICKITDGHKAPVIQNLIDDNDQQGPFFFLDDKPEHFIDVKKLPTKVITILVDHNEKKGGVVPNESCDHIARSLLEAARLIDRYI